MDTVPLPVIRDDRPPNRPVSRGLRALEVVAGLASAGVVVIGLGLVVLQVLAGRIAPGSGLSAASGPTWTRALAQLGVGLVGEVVVGLRARLPHAGRTWLAVGVLVAVGAVLWLCWWA